MKKPEGGLLQSREWMDVLRAEKKVIYEIVSDHSVWYMVKNFVPVFGAYMYMPRVFDVDAELLKKAVTLGKKKNVGWIRVDAGTKNVEQVMKTCDLRVVNAPHDMQPRYNLIMDITRSEEDLLRQMKSKTRYNIRLAQKKKVEIIVSKEQKYIDRFYAMVDRTAERKNVAFHEKEHYEKIVAYLPKDNVDLYVAKYNDRIIAANLMVFYGGVATYLHGATSDEHRDVMAPFLLQWRAMCDAKNRGCEWYDLGGVFPHVQDVGKRGITRFKKGFAPQEVCVESQGSFDIILSPMRYFGYRLTQRVRGIFL